MTRQDHAGPEVQDLLRHGGELRLRVGRGAHRGPGRLDHAARRRTGARPRTSARCRDITLVTAAPVPDPLPDQTTGQRRRGPTCDADRHAGPLERGDRQLRRLPGLGVRPERVRRQGGRGVDLLRPGLRGAGSASSSTTRRSAMDGATEATRLRDRQRRLGRRGRARGSVPNDGNWARRSRSVQGRPRRRHRRHPLLRLRPRGHPRRGDAQRVHGGRHEYLGVLGSAVARRRRWRAAAAVARPRPNPDYRIRSPRASSGSTSAGARRSALSTAARRHVALAAQVTVAARAASRR